MDTSPFDRLADARATLAKTNAATAAALLRAAESERARAGQESRHAETVADSFLNGDKVPAKPPGLSAAQALDDSCAAALAILERRQVEASGAVHSAACAVLDSRLNELVEVRHAAARDAARMIVEGAKNLAHTLGLNVARSVLASVAVLPMRDDLHMVAVHELAGELPELVNIAGLAHVRFTEAHLVPNADELTNLFRSI